MSISKKVKLAIDVWSQIRSYARKIHGPYCYICFDMLWCGLRYGASPANYYNFDFVNRTAKERKTYVTHRISEQLMRRFNAPEARHIFEDKIVFANTYREYYHRSFLNSANMSEDDFRTLVEDSRKIICKPIRGGQGRGIHCFDLTQDSFAEVFQQIKGLPESIVETWIDQDDRMSAFYPDAVNPIRIQTVVHAGKAHCLSATITVGNGEKYSNASAKALFALIDMNTGIVKTDGCDYDYNLYSTHPITGIRFKGFQVPRWDEVLQVVSDAAVITPKIGYAGWDVAISKNGPVIIEANNDPGYTAYQLAILTRKKEGTKGIYLPFLE